MGKDFFCSPVIRTLHFNAEDAGSIPVWRTKILFAVWPNKKEKVKSLFLKYFLDNFTYLIFEISVMLLKRFTKGVLLALPPLFCELIRLHRMVNDNIAVIKARIKASVPQGECAAQLCRILAA